MGITVQTPMAEIRRELEREVELRKRVLRRSLLAAAEEISNTATAGSTNPYTDRTGNLRSSVGAVVVQDGKIVGRRGFEKVNHGVDGDAEGRDYAESLAKNSPSGTVLIAVAGKKYASYVADKGYDVLDSAELLAERIVPQMLAELNTMM